MTELTEKIQEAIANINVPTNKDLHNIIEEKVRDSTMFEGDVNDVVGFVIEIVKNQQKTIQDMFDELHALADDSKFVSLKDQQRWRDGEITILELVEIGRESIS